MLPLAHAGLTTPAVAGPGCNEWLGITAPETACEGLCQLACVWPDRMQPLKLRVVHTEISHAQVLTCRAERLFETVRRAGVGASTQYGQASSAQKTTLVLVHSEQVSQAVQQRLCLCTHAVPIERGSDHPGVVPKQALNQRKEVIALICAFVRVVADVQLAEIFKRNVARRKREVDECPCVSSRARRCEYQSSGHGNVFVTPNVRVHPGRGGRCCKPGV